jgi:5,10-methylene-tetrahydrofolate dehydrogenase/methenyl tetrahydrofolate cyclohydrolase
MTDNFLLIQGCIELLQRSGVSISGKRAIVVGRSNIEGLSVALLLIRLDATVTIVHSKTPDPKSIISKADIIISSLGHANMVHSKFSI